MPSGSHRSRQTVRRLPAFLALTPEVLPLQQLHVVPCKCAPRTSRGMNVSPHEQLRDPRPRPRERKKQVNEEEVRDVVGLHLRFGIVSRTRGHRKQSSCRPLWTSAVEEIEVTVHSRDHEVERPTPSASQRQWAYRWHPAAVAVAVPAFANTLVLCDHFASDAALTFID